jgi:SAM-dependent methyltransferase
LQKASFDAAICRLGLMFFPDPGKGLREIFRALKSGGRAVRWCFQHPTRIPASRYWSRPLSSTPACRRGPYQPGGLLSLGKPGLIDDLFRQAGFSRAAIRHPSGCPPSKTISILSARRRVQSRSFLADLTEPKEM